MQTTPFFIHALSPLHAGIGQGVGAIDLPIARDVASGRPLVPGSSIKGALRDVHERDVQEQDIFKKRITHAVFGPSSDEIDRAGAAMFSDARLLVFPVRSLSGTFAWVTCPDALLGFQREVELCGTQSIPTKVPEPTNTECYCPVADKNNSVHVQSAIVIKEQNSNSDGTVEPSAMICLEDLDLLAAWDSSTSEWAQFIAAFLFPDPDSESWQKQFVGRFCIVHDNIFNFLTETATDVRARIVLDDNKTVQNLWYEESLPAESILTGLLHISVPPITRKENLNTAQVLKEVREILGKPVQLGGKATIGRGLCGMGLIENSQPQTMEGEQHANS